MRRDTLCWRSRFPAKRTLSLSGVSPPVQRDPKRVRTDRRRSLKDLKMTKLGEAITKAHNGEVILHPKVASRVLQNIRRDSEKESIIYTELTERELDVLKLIANGYSNSQIAEDLVISENTVKGHVSNILSKLHLADRTQAAVFAWQQGIVKREINE